MTSQTEPVLIHGNVHVKSMPEQKRFYATQPRTYVLRSTDTQPQLIRPRTRSECHTVIVAMSAPNTAAPATPASGWISDNEADCDRQAGALVQSNMAGPIELEGNTELWAMIDPGSVASLYLTVFVEIESM